MIPTEVKPFARNQQNRMRANPMLRFANDGFRMKLLKGAIDKLTSQQMAMLEEVANYVGEHKAQVANGSFGTGYRQVKMITDALFTVFFFRKPKKEESHMLASYFVNSLIKQGDTMVGAAKDTLFVFAAGNDGLDNDKFPVSPTNIQADNVISVAATYKYKFLAPFSNYGSKMVDVAAPGMLIHSQIPGDEYLRVSGTSQAAPFVANVAARIVDANPSLKPVEIKKILMGTIDSKSFLKDKIKTEGIVNPDRAIMAAKLSKTMTVDEAINDSMTQVRDVDTGTKGMDFMLNPSAITPIPLPSSFN